MRRPCPVRAGRGRAWRRARGRSVAIALALLGAAPGALSAAPASDRPDENGSDRLELTLDELRTFTDLFQLLRSNYVDPVDESELIEAALRGMVRELDVNSAYLSPEEFRQQDDSSRGRTAGIGADIRLDEGRLRVAAVTPGGPAAGAGIAPGELIVAIDGRAVKGRPLPGSLRALGGTPGTRVRLRIQAPDGARRSVVLERAWVPVPSVRAALLERRFAYLGLSHFHDGSAQELRASLDDLADPLGGPEALHGIVLDLRGNRGGVIGGAVDIVDGFLDAGLVVRVRGRSEGSRLEYRAEPGEWAPGVPVTVLIDGASASASEIVAGALQDHGRATVLGARSFGKGTVQSVLPLRNGGALKLTTARFYLPSGASFADRGIEPDVVVAADDAEGTRSGTSTPSPGSDAVLAAALEVLRSGLESD